MVRRFGTDGAALGPAAPVSADLTGYFDGSGLVTLSNGHVAAGWGVSDFTAGTSRIGAFVMDPATGNLVGAEIPVATGGAFSEGVNFHQIVALDGGRAGLMYTDGAGSPDRLKLLIIEADGTAGATSTLLTSAGPYVGIGIHDAAAALQGPNAGVLALAAQAFNGFTSVSQIVFRNLDGSVAALPAFIPDNPERHATVLAARPDGGLVVAHALTIGASASVVRVYFLDAAGALEGTARDITFDVSSFGTTELGVLPDGGVLVAISGYAPGIFDSNVLGQRLNADGTPDGAVMRLDSTIQGQQTRPEMTMTGNGTLVVAWEDTNNGFDYQIRAARFDLAPPGGAQSGTGGAEALVGGEGADTLQGRGGDDSLAGAGGDDRLLGMIGADSLLGEAGADTLIGSLGADTLDGGEGADLTNGGAEADRLLGGAGNDTLVGGEAADTLEAGADGDRVRGDAGDDLADGGEGADTVLGGVGADTLDGGGGEDVLRGGTENDLLRGGGGDDRLFGDAGADTLLGGAGADTLRGGTEGDVFAYADLADSTDAATDLLFDFARGTDLLDLSALDADAATAGDDAFTLIGTAAFSGGAGVAELRMVRDFALRQLRIELDTADADAEADMVIVLKGLPLLGPGDLLL
ncbi:calcium-binding protein [Falsiroseomonas sp.]|uniref:calcium-binding protein n=1 Tax=Falsiroseomonas sp. TaxID=2870721 RepID=UPI00356AA1F0